MERRLIVFLLWIAVAVALLTWYHVKRVSPFEKSAVFAPYIDEQQESQSPDGRPEAKVRK
ncbi:hypothetical protein [Thalassolituus sp.]|uniref:hypothetical protein n=1 Tax=Thalassolituus sp. TaxID=2030822 RepID=UPI0026178D9A|nr:hypothetical protein [uncultured Thalassolituus sp.]TNC91457.1 MAG: hypothetical protein CSH36_09555 [Thalassolituus sp.]